MEQGVVLLAIAAALGPHEFRDQRRGIEFHGTAEERIQVLESDPRQMLRDERLQHHERRLARPGIADTGEIGGKIDTGTHRVTIHAEPGVHYPPYRIAVRRSSRNDR